MMSNSGLPKPLTVLLAEDSRVQAQLVEIIIGEIPELELLETVEDGSYALAFLRREGKYADAKRPDLVLLDINMPEVGGFEVLSQMKADPKLSQIPVVILTSSSDDKDIVKSYEHGASTYIEKPVDSKKLEEILGRFAKYWAGARLPPQ
jgi:CheY-like chemotaxis protein